MSGLDQLYQALILQHAKERHGLGLDRVNTAATGTAATGTAATGTAATGTAATGGTTTGESHQYNPLCGDEVTLRVAVGPDGDVRDLAWAGEGCSISQASTSTLHDLVVGLPGEEAVRVVEAFRTMIRSRGAEEPDEEVLGDAVAFAGVGRHANRVKCAMLGWTAFEDALHRATSAGPGPLNPTEETA